MVLGYKCIFIVYIINTGISSSVIKKLSFGYYDYPTPDLYGVETEIT